jgi:uncharacterized protein with von Willebrand factor type A (vWA) domain
VTQRQPGVRLRAGDPRAAIAGGLVVFAKLLRRAGVEVGTGAVQTAAAALGRMDADRRDEVYWALRCTLLSHRRQVEAFDSAFSAFWGEAPLAAGLDRSEAAPARGEGVAEAGEGARELSGAWPGEAEGADADEASGAGASWSPGERLKELDFAAYGPEELARARRLIERVARSLPMRRSRRARPFRSGRRVDPRRTLRESLRTGGHPMELHWQQQKQVPRKLVFVVDVSGSMEPYARPVVMFLHSARRSSRKVEAFAFGTRLTRLTRALDAGGPEASLVAVAGAVPDWAGGTRIGESLAALRRSSPGGGTLAGALVVIVSDGWERGDLPLLRAEMERLHRAAYAVVWVNPLAGDPGYEPLAAGMAAALPYVDVFLPGHNLRALEALAEALERLSGERPGGETRSPAGGTRRNAEAEWAPTAASTM